MQRIARLLAAGVLVAGLAACGTANAGDPPTGTAASTDPNAIRVVAKDIAFQQKDAATPANRAFQIAFDNEDAAPHNITIVAADGSIAFQGDVFTGEATRTYAVPALKAGTYQFRCDVHSNMTGTLTVR